MDTESDAHTGRRPRVHEGRDWTGASTCHVTPKMARTLGERRAWGSFSVGPWEDPREEAVPPTAASQTSGPGGHEEIDLRV